MVHPMWSQCVYFGRFLKLSLMKMSIFTLSCKYNIFSHKQTMSFVYFVRSIEEHGRYRGDSNPKI